MEQSTVVVKSEIAYAIKCSQLSPCENIFLIPAGVGGELWFIACSAALRGGGARDALQHPCPQFRGRG